MKLHRRKRVHINGITSVLTRKLNYKYKYESKINNSDLNKHSSVSLNLDDVSKITETQKLSLAEMVLAPHTISLQLKRLEKRYQSEYLRCDLKARKPENIGG